MDLSVGEQNERMIKMNELGVQWKKNEIDGGLIVRFKSATDSMIFITDARLFKRDKKQNIPLDGFLVYPVIFNKGKSELHFSITEKDVENNDELRLQIVNKEQHCGWKVILNLKTEGTLVEKIPHEVV